MRYGFLSLVIVVLVVTASESQDTKKKDKEPDKKKELPGKEKDPKTVTEPEITEVLGKSFKEWQKEIHHADPSKRETAMKTILLFGPNKAYDAVPDLLFELKKHTATTPVDLAVRVNGTMTLSTIFKYKMEPDPKQTKEAAIYRAQVKEAVAIYRTFLKDDQVMLRIRTVQGLAYLGPACRDAYPEVQKMAAAKESLTWEARKEAVQVIGIIGFSDLGSPQPGAMGEVQKALGDTSYQVRIAALQSITRLGMAATPEQKAPIISRLNAFVDAEPDLQVAVNAHLAIMTLEKKITPRHLNPVIKLLKHKDSSLRLVAVQLLAATGKDGKPAIPSLLEAVYDPEVNIGVAAIYTLLSLEADELIPVLKKIAKDENAEQELYDAAMEATEVIENRDKMRKEKKAKDKK